MRRLVDGVALAGLWGPAIALLSDAAEQASTEHVVAFAMVNAGWARWPGCRRACGGVLADAAGDHLPYVVLSVLSLATLAATLLHRPAVRVATVSQTTQLG